MELARCGVQKSDDIARLARSLPLGSMTGAASVPSSACCSPLFTNSTK